MNLRRYFKFGAATKGFAMQPVQSVSTVSYYCCHYSSQTIMNVVVILVKIKSKTFVREKSYSKKILHNARRVQNITDFLYFTVR
jgi:hypothetical protein